MNTVMNHISSKCVQFLGQQFGWGRLHDFNRFHTDPSTGKKKIYDLHLSDMARTEFTLFWLEPDAVSSSIEELGGLCEDEKVFEGALETLGRLTGNAAILEAMKDIYENRDSPLKTGTGVNYALCVKHGPATDMLACTMVISSSSHPSASSLVIWAAHASPIGPMPIAVHYL